MLSRQANGGWSQARYQRRRDLHVAQHIGAVIDELLELHESHPFGRLVLGGAATATRELQTALPPVLADAFAGTFAAELTLADDEILTRTLAAAAEDERAGETTLVDELLADAAAGGVAVVGLEPTLDALWRAAVHELVVVGGATAPGAACPACLRLITVELAPAGDTSEDENQAEDNESGTEADTDTGTGTETPAPVEIACPVCAATMEMVEDIIERAAADAVLKGGTVEIVHGEAAERLAQAGGPLAARLRFRPDADPATETGQAAPAVAGE